MASTGYNSRLPAKRYRKQVSTENCKYAHEFKDAIIANFTPMLDTFTPILLRLYQREGYDVTKIDPQTLVSDLKR